MRAYKNDKSMPKIHRHTLIVYIEKVIIYLLFNARLGKNSNDVEKNSSDVEKSINRADSESVESFGML